MGKSISTPMNEHYNTSKTMVVYSVYRYIIYYLVYIHKNHSKITFYNKYLYFILILYIYIYFNYVISQQQQIQQKSKDTNHPVHVDTYIYNFIKY